MFGPEKLKYPGERLIKLPRGIPKFHPKTIGHSGLKRDGAQSSSPINTQQTSHMALNTNANKPKHKKSLCDSRSIARLRNRIDPEWLSEILQREKIVGFCLKSGH
jgi:hypothetical protein